MYAPGVMERVSNTRGLPVVSCMAAHPTQPIGAWLTITNRQTGVSLLCRVTDTSEPWDRPRHIKTGLIELDYASAKALCGARWTGNSRECKIRWKVRN